MSNILREKIARLIWGMDQNSVERPFERLSGPVLNDLLDTADSILDIPELAQALQHQQVATEFRHHDSPPA